MIDAPEFAEGSGHRLADKDISKRTDPHTVKEKAAEHKRFIPPFL